ncbi:hypothetical protein ACOI22_03560 [Glaciecola sp. 2405UD65-10]|uniref:hypothetical protein n=1 Tax=Glaciecola sp. 2405UD65-10 TaxID=3397244 RepID=UPI003B5ACF0C
MKNTLTDLNNHLFAQLERLGDEDLSPDDLNAEINRSKAIQGIAAVAIGNAKLVLDAAEFKMNHIKGDLPPMLDVNKPKAVAGPNNG